jgi:hypothetical protein
MRRTNQGITYCATPTESFLRGGGKVVPMLMRRLGPGTAAITPVGGAATAKDIRFTRAACELGTMVATLPRLFVALALIGPRVIRLLFIFY